MPNGKQLTLDFDAADRERERLAAMPDKQWERAQQICAARIQDGRDDHGKLVSGSTLQLVLLAISSFCKRREDWCYASARSIGERCGDPSWSRLIPRGKRLSTRTVKSAIQALMNTSPELLDRMLRTKTKRRSEPRRILWQYLQPASGALERSNGALVHDERCTSSIERCTSAPQLSERNLSKGNLLKEPSIVVVDDDAVREKAKQFAAIFPCSDLDLRRRVLRICVAWNRGNIDSDVCEDVLRELARIKRRESIHRPYELLYKLFANRGISLDRLIVKVPQQLLSPPAAAAAPTNA